MNKFAEQFQNDVITRYQEKLAGSLLDKIIHAIPKVEVYGSERPTWQSLFDKVKDTIPKVEVYGSERPTWQSLFDKVRQLKPTVHF